MNYNSLTLCGRVARSEEIVYHGAGNACKKFCLAVETRLGENKTELLYLDCALWGKRAEALHQYIVKGREILVQGRLRMGNWDCKQTGQKRIKHTCVVQDVQLGAMPKGQQEQQNHQSGGYSQGDQQQQYAQAPHEGDEDIPF